MRKYFFYSNLRSRRAQSRRCAFSLAEMIVSVGILVLMLSVAGEVLTLTMRATGQSKGLTEVQQQIRVVERLLREDLRAVDRHRSVMVIEGNPIDAYWTQAGKDADSDPIPTNGYPGPVDFEREDPSNPGVLERPRADKIMFFTNRPATSNVFPEVASNVQQVVYGHADFGTYAQGVTPPLQEGDFVEDIPSFPPTSVQPNEPNTSPLPAERWLLSRRQVLLLPNAPLPPRFTPALTGLDDARILRGQSDVLYGFPYEELVLTPSALDGPGQGYWPPILRGLGKDEEASGPIQQAADPLQRSKLDPQPPPTLPSALNHFLLPHCASFKVEWALDPRSDFVGGLLDKTSRVYWIDPGILPGVDDSAGPGQQQVTPLQALERAAAQQGLPARADIESLLTELRGGSGNYAYTLQQRFGRVDGLWHPESRQQPPHRRNLAVFTASRWRNPDEQTVILPEQVFPIALRITVDVFDRARRLERPIRHVMVIPVGAS